MMTSREDRIASMESMSDRQSSTPEAAERVIHNPVSGERMVIRTTSAQTDGRLLVFDLSLPPGGHVPARHAHPGQEERFTVIEGSMRFRFAGKTCAVNPGESVVVPKGQPHWFGNPGPEPSLARVEVRPALRTQEFFEANERIAHAGHFLGTRLPRLSDLAAVLLEYEREVSVPDVPATVVRRLLAPLAWFGRRRLRAR